MRLDKQSLRELKDISYEFECEFDLGRLLKKVDVALYGFYREEISKAARRAFELGYSKGVASIKCE